MTPGQAILLFQFAVNAARSLAGQDRGSTAAGLLHFAGEAAGLPAEHLSGLAGEVLKGRRGNGFHGTLGCRHPGRFYWMVEAEDGEWCSVATDQDDFYWGGEIGCRSESLALAEALAYQARWPEAEIRIRETHAEYGQREVLRVPAAVMTGVLR